MDKALLKKARLAEEDVDLPGVGVIRVRALSRAEALRVTDTEMPVTRMEQLLLSMAMVDPEMSEQDVAEWQSAASAGELEPVTEVIKRLSGLAEKAAKSGVPGVRTTT
jgi:predicted transcriptional regulator